MPDHFLELRIEELLLTHTGVNKNKVGKYIMKYAQNEEVEPVSVTYCVHTGKYILDDGHHRVVAFFFLKNSFILAKIEPCYEYECNGFEPNIREYNIRHIVLK